MALKKWGPIFLISCVFASDIYIDQIVPDHIGTNTYKLNASYKVVLIYKDLPELKTINPFRIITRSTSSSSRRPILVVSEQERFITAWSVPLLVEQSNHRGDSYFSNVSKIMCHDYMETIVSSNLPALRSRAGSDIAQTYIISLSTSSNRNVDLDISLEEQTDFYVHINQNYNLSVSPSEPKYVFYKFDENTSDTVVIQVDSEDEICLTVSVQDSKCPVFDTNKDIKYEGIRQTINLKGTIILKRKDFGEGGFFLVFVAKPDNYECSQQNSYLPRTMRLSRVAPINATTHLTFSIKNGISYDDYLTAIVVTLGTLGLAGIILFVIALVFNRRGTISREKNNDKIPYEYVMPLTVTQISKLLETKDLKVSAFSRHPIRIKKRSYNYLSHILSIAIFYSIPVIQLVFTYQRIVNQTGNEDMCYYNFMCAHPVAGFSDFNHIFSNIGYVIFGVLIILVVVDRHRIVNMRKEKGIPVHYGLFHAMGVALIIEGLLSACYHICPSQSNYQFDTSFMYVMAVLCMIKLYQNRHPDINATAYTTFTILGIAIFMASVGILNGSMVIWIIFAISYTALCIGLSFKIYFINYVIQGIKQFKDDITINGCNAAAFMPMRRGRFILLLIANLANYAMLITGLCLYSTNFTDFGTFLLGLLLGNALIHTFFYTAMKLLHGEKICFEAILYGLLSVAAWAGSAVFFLDAATLWTVTPAESRQWNQECILLKFFDKHDVWHLLSASALYFSFMFLMSLDDDIIDKKHEDITSF